MAGGISLLGAKAAAGAGTEVPAEDLMVEVDANAASIEAEAGGRIIYRGLAEGEDPALGLTARAPEASGVTPMGHVAGAAKSPWISASKDIEVATTKYGKFGTVAIDLSKVESEVADISGGFPGSPEMLSNWARADQEVLIRGYFPPEAIISRIPR